MMFIVSKERDNIINTSQITNIFAGGDGYTVKAAFANGSGCQIGRYSRPVANKVIEMIGLAAGRTEVYFMPQDEEVDAKQNAEQTRYHHITGKKTKGHGGS